MFGGPEGIELPGVWAGDKREAKTGDMLEGQRHPLFTHSLILSKEG